MGLRKLFPENFFPPKVVLYLNIPKINGPVSDSGRLNQHQLLSPAEPDFLFASMEPTLTGFWWSQRAQRVPPPPAKGVWGWQDRSPDTSWIHFFPSLNSVAEECWSTEKGFFTPKFGRSCSRLFFQGLFVGHLPGTAAGCWEPLATGSSFWD